MPPDFLSLHGLTPYQFHALLDTARHIKDTPGRYRRHLRDRTLALVLPHADDRIRIPLQLGLRQLGGSFVSLCLADHGRDTLGQTSDMMRNLERWVDAIALRGFAQDFVARLARQALIPIINAGSELLQPVAAMADIFTIRETRRDLGSLRLAYVGAGNGICHSLLAAAAKAGMEMRVATPVGHAPSQAVLRQVEDDGRETGFDLQLTLDPAEAVRGADVVYTSCWPPQARESSSAQLRELFRPYQITEELLRTAAPDALFMHSQPLRRGEEVEEAVLEAFGSTVFLQAENMLHIQKAIMVLWMVDKYDDG